MKNERLSPDKMAWEFLKPIAAWAAERGNKAKLVEALQQHVPTINRQLVSRWLNDDPEKRVEPTLGNALLLARVFDTITPENNNTTP